MSQTATRPTSPVKWLLVNGTFATVAIFATVGENKSALNAVTFLTGLYLFASLVQITVPGILVAASQRLKPTKFFVALDVLYDGALLTLLCVYAPWYTWGMYLTAAIVSVYTMLTVRAYAATSPV